ncbi:hypothetical protein [Pelagicoccus mobilis]|uniref:Uncharacterized protein n=1 Tax=Pelagicoccus mobilis TaxID=415221 RepID=A0A934VRB4_9BACT|nr:hypothetical protein [Pelagicoccus mobilis]MBK1879217.1 hypothetical protein [Pelagicoccus mobilis]
MVQISDQYLEPQDLSRPPPEERERLQRLWDSGKLQQHAKALERFYRKKHQELRQLLSSTYEDDDLIEAAKILVIQNKIVDQIAEGLDQLKAMESEIWIQGEQGNHDRAQIALEWTERHAAAWREWRIKEYLYTVERMEQSLKNCLTAS